MLKSDAVDSQTAETQKRRNTSIQPTGASLSPFPQEPFLSWWNFPWMSHVFQVSAADWPTARVMTGHLQVMVKGNFVAPNFCWKDGSESCRAPVKP